MPQGEKCVSPAAHTGVLARRASWCASSPGCASWPAASRPASSSASAPARVAGDLQGDVEEGITPDFIVVDGAEGGTGAAPLEYEDHVGTPLTEGLMTVHNALVGTGLRDRVRIGASGKVATGIDIVKRLIQGADYTNAARAMMMAVGCIQAPALPHQHAARSASPRRTRKRARALDVADKTERVRRYQDGDGRSEAVQIMASMGVDGPARAARRTC